jgi:hypothetical protein
LVILEQNSIDMMTQHGLEGTYSVDNITSSDSRVSSESPNSMSIKFFRHRVFTIAHVDINVNLKRKRHVSNNFKKVQIVKTLALKKK